MFRKEQTRRFGKFILYLMNSSTLITVSIFALFITLLIAVVIIPLAHFGAQSVAQSILREMFSPGFLKDQNIRGLEYMQDGQHTMDGLKHTIKQQEEIIYPLPMENGDETLNEGRKKEGLLHIHAVDIIVEIKGENIFISRNLLSAVEQGKEVMVEENVLMRYFNRPYSAPVLDSLHNEIGRVTTRIYPPLLVMAFSTISIVVILLGMLCLVVNYLLSRWLIAPMIRPLAQLRDQFQKLADGEVSEVFEQGLQMDKPYVEIKEIADQASRIIANTKMYLEQLQDQNEELEAQKEELEAQQEELQFHATTDGLTGLLNRRHFLDIARKRLREEHVNVSLMLFDIDDFKCVNDRYGHISGDQVLTDFSLILQKAAGNCTLVGRFGGEEFAVFLTGMDKQQCSEMAEHLRKSIESATIRLDIGSQVRVTTSIGMVFTTSDRVEIEELYQRADKALYESKETGKNRVTLNELISI
ncbi:GGDEF domain-containing protein [Paenibacillus sp. 19GGS1-52]|uniref:GGDEF domain-containing protein n=1 Tax=Paenibacillus sp. 19GGS1-52 TaxID=2758563 RepID=UPI001EFB7345|nr:GGDEF domain-containing protein [Paenibacillus sp. 19GGS1-52]ULO05529.1 GGDEF domain-containing protein [Paenibacillus sp. 19GGS1-52]